jgi:two-component system cell cycle sensor histidine kinase/response regulator CckA
MIVQDDHWSRQGSREAPCAKWTNPLKNLPGGTESILFVDDEASLAKLGANLLDRIGYRAMACNGSKEALDLFKTDPSRYDLLITDLSMPGMSGLELAAACKAIRPGFPAILCTGHGAMDPEVEQSADKLKIDGILAKPVMLRDMAFVIRKVLNRQTTNGVES